MLFRTVLPASRRFVGTVVARSPHPLGYHFEPLMEQKVAWGAVGRCMLAHLPEEEVAKAVAEAGKPPAGTAAPSLKDMKERLTEIRDRGFASAEGEIFPKRSGSPVSSSMSTAMLWVAWHHHADDPLSSGDAQAIANLVISKAKELSNAPGYREAAEPVINVRPQRRAR